MSSTLEKQNVLIFGASGAIGSAVSEIFKNDEYVVFSAGRGAAGVNDFQWDVGCTDPSWMKTLAGAGKRFDSIVWAQGVNYSDSVYDFDLNSNIDMYKANVAYIMLSLSQLLEYGLVRRGARLCIISSIWQERARQNKMSYCVTKSALKGLVLSLAADLAKENIVVNAVLPGVIDTPMTRENLSLEQLVSFEKATYFERLATLKDVSSTVQMLCSQSNTSITGQFIAVDLGYSNVRIV